MKLRSILVALLVLAVVALGVVAIVHSRTQACKTLQIMVTNAKSDPDITPKEISNLLHKNGVSPIGRSVKALNRPAMERALRQNVWFDSITALRCQGSKVILEVRAKEPLVQVFPVEGDPYMLSSNGEFLPWHDAINRKFFVLNGEVHSQYAPGMNVQKSRERALQNALRVALYLRSDATASAQYTQLYAAQNGDIQLYNNLSGHLVLVGNGENMKVKMQNLQKVYSQGLVYLPMQQYDKLDARYKGKVYASKKVYN